MRPTHPHLASVTLPDALCRQIRAFQEQGDQYSINLLAAANPDHTDDILDLANKLETLDGIAGIKRREWWWTV